MSFIRHGGRVIQFHELMVLEDRTLCPCTESVISMAEMVSDVEKKFLL